MTKEFCGHQWQYSPNGQLCVCSECGRAYKLVEGKWVYQDTASPQMLKVLKAAMALKGASESWSKGKAPFEQVQEALKDAVETVKELKS